MKYKSFIGTFFFTLILTVLGHVFFISLIDPQQTAPLSLSKSHENYHDNFLLKKVKLIERFPFETLILGSSTSEAFLVSEVNHHFKTQSFHASIGGGSTVARYTLFKKALKSNNSLKRVIYIADFFEMNKLSVPDLIAFNNELKMEIDTQDFMPHMGHYLKYLFSHQMLESAFLVMKRKRKNYHSPLLVDGSTGQSMILSTVETLASFNSKISSHNRIKLNEEILENYGTYSNNVLAGFEELNIHAKNLVESLVSESQKKSIEVIFILAPYHESFRKKLLSNPKLSKRYLEWITFFESLNSQSGVFVYNPTTSNIAIDPDSGVWRDGIHFNQFAATYFLKEIAENRRLNHE
ncbi:MAG: hypothetical protein HOP07_11345 [Bacteriovoracaceae bacterium]|nr:hypothetical protein [Bacteriovoracaceae bacterium]